MKGERFMMLMMDVDDDGVDWLWGREMEGERGGYGWERSERGVWEFREGDS